MTEMKSTGAAGWLMSFACATVDHCIHRLRGDFDRIKDEGGALAHRRLVSGKLPPEDDRRLAELGTMLASIAHQMSGAQQSLIIAADRLHYDGSEECHCDDCSRIRDSFVRSLTMYWGRHDVLRPAPWASIHLMTSTSSSME